MFQSAGAKENQKKEYIQSEVHQVNFYLLHIINHALLEYGRAYLFIYAIHNKIISSFEYINARLFQR